MNVVQAAILAGSAAIAGAINSVAGGGTLISFPGAIAVGLTPLFANATNSVALTPGAFASAFAYRRELARDSDKLRLFLPAAATGGVAGAVLLLVTPQSLFDAIVPFLVLFATLLLVLQNLRGAPRSLGDGWQLSTSRVTAMLLQFLVAVYGGYFGAGVGIMMLALYARLGAADIHRMNGVKSVTNAVINAIAAVAFMVAGKIDYGAAAVMAIGAIAGGFAGGSMARRVNPRVVRWGVVAIGFTLTASLGYRRWATQ